MNGDSLLSPKGIEIRDKAKAFMQKIKPMVIDYLTQLTFFIAR
jgi:hypothetical protein